MSFILDALRKSESERQQDARPSIARIPSAMPQHGLPAWAVATMAALGLGVIVLAGAWVKTITESPPSASASASADPATARDPDRGRAAPSAATYAGRDAPRQEVGSASEASPRAGYDQRRVEPLPLPAPRTAADASPLAQAVQPPPLALAARASASARDNAPPDRGATPPPDATTGRSAARVGDPLPAVEGIAESYHSVAASLGLPPLTLELLAYADDPAKQFVFINGARYAAGDRLPGGARVIAINARGAVLLVNGRQLQLEPR